MGFSHSLISSSLSVSLFFYVCECVYLSLSLSLLFMYTQIFFPPLFFISFFLWLFGLRSFRRLFVKARHSFITTTPLHSFFLAFYLFFFFQLIFCACVCAPPFFFCFFFQVAKIDKTTSG